MVFTGHPWCLMGSKMYVVEEGEIALTIVATTAAYLPVKDYESAGSPGIKHADGVIVLVEHMDLVNLGC